MNANMLRQLIVQGRTPVVLYAIGIGLACLTAVGCSKDSVSDISQSGDSVTEIQEEERTSQSSRQKKILERLEELHVSVYPINGDPKNGWSVAVVPDVSYAGEEHLSLIMALDNVRALHLGGAFSDDAIEKVVTMDTVEKLGLTQTAVTDAGLSLLPKMQDLRELFLRESYGPHASMTNMGLQSVGKISKLESLTLWGPGFTAEGLDFLKDLNNLHTLELQYASVFKDDEVAHLQAFEELQQLSLRTQTDNALAHLVPLQKLEQLQFKTLKFTGEGLVYLKRLPILTSLNFYDWSCTPAEMDRILRVVGELNQLQALDLNMTNETGDGFRHLTGLDKLERLEIENTAVTDEGLQYLAGLKNLKFVNASRSEVTEQGKRQLEAAVPGVRVQLE